MKVASCAARISGGKVESSAPASRNVREILAADLDPLRGELLVLTLRDTDFHLAKNRTEALLWRHSEPSQAPAYLIVVFPAWMMFATHLVALDK